MNSLALFIGGLLLGVLLSLSFVNRMKLVNSNTSIIEGNEKSSKYPDTKLSDFLKENNNTTVASPNDVISHQKKISALEIPLIKSTDSEIDNVASSKPRWAPGKEGKSLKSKATGNNDASSLLVSSVQSSKQAETISDEPTVDSGKKSLRGKMKRKFLKEKAASASTQHQIGVPSAAIAVSRDENAESTSSTVVALRYIPPAGDSGVSQLASATVSVPSYVSALPLTSRLNASLPRLASVPNPFIPYHSQAARDFEVYKAYIPSLDTVSANSKATASPLPDLSKQRGAFEKDNLKLHLCNGVFEAYSASYLTTKHHMLNVASEGYNLSWVNCEMASFVHMKESNKFYSNPQSEGVIMQALDVLDFSVIHLSAFERSSRKYKDALWKTKAELKVEWTKIEPVKRAGQRLALLNNPSLPSHRKIHYSIEAQRTVVIMPFLGGAMGAGHSELGNRFEYLKTCFWSFYEFVPNIVAGVTRQEDVDWCMKESGLPFYDIILLPNLPKSAGLPVGTTQQTKLRLQDGRWDFDYVFFTESDQILISRELQLMYEHLKKFPGHMVLPHRLMPYSDRVTSEVHKRNAPSIVENAWMNQSCCMPRQNCVERKTWLPIKDTRVPIINYYGLYVPLGNVNFLDESFRACKLGSYVGDFCP